MTMIEQPAGPYTLYYLGFGADQRPVYVGITRTPLKQRLQNHIGNARSPAGRAKHPIARRIQAEAEQGRPVWLKVLMEDLSEETAKEQEIKVIQGLRRAGIALENCNLLGKHGLANRHPAGSLEYEDAKREHGREYLRDRRARDPEYREACLAHHHEHQATDPKYRNRKLANSALWRLKRGGGVTPRRVEVLTLDGRAADALAILREQGREDEWTGGTAV